VASPPEEPVDALAVLGREIPRRLARDDEVLVYAGRRRGEPAEELHERVRLRRVSVAVDRALCALKVLDPLLPAARPFRTTPLYFPCYARAVAADAVRRDVDLVHAFTVPQLLPVLRTRHPRARLVLHVQDHSLVQRERAWLARQLACADAVVACSAFVADAVRQRLPELAARCHAVPNGVDAERFAPEAEAPPRPADAPLRVLFVGRLSPEKGVHGLLHAFERVLTRHPRARLELIGPDALAPFDFVDPAGEDPLLAGLRPLYAQPGRYAAELRRSLAPPVATRVTFAGAVPHDRLPERYRAADVFVFPSLWHEPFGIPLLEAMASGLPVLATRGGAFPEIVGDGRSGLLVPRGDVEALAEALSELLGDPARRAALGREARARVLRSFTWDRVVERLREVYAEATAARVP
jgi:glycosyltransferase involved in cell wall biosynthesis